MPWQADAPNLGFTTGKPWLPMAPAHRALAADVQERDEQSVLHFARRAIAERKKHSALAVGEFAQLPSTGQVLAFERRHGSQRIVCVFNLTRGEAALSMSWSADSPRLPAVECGSARTQGATLILEPLSAYIAVL
jgi:alpha-glucosidase